MRVPRAPKRHRIVECFTDCRARATGEGADCDCLRRDEEAYADECERRYDAWKERRLTHEDDSPALP